MKDRQSVAAGVIIVGTILFASLAVAPMCGSRPGAVGRNTDGKPVARTPPAGVAVNQKAAVRPKRGAATRFRGSGRAGLFVHRGLSGQGLALNLE